MSAPPLDLSVYLVTDTRLCGARGVVDTVTAAVAGGVTVVQLRDPNASARELVELGLRLREALSGLGIPLLINDRADVARAVGADGVHVGQRDLPAPAAREIVGPDAYVGLSVHDVADLYEDDGGGHDEPHRSGPATLRLRDELAAVDYLGVGPVFAQQTKPDAGTPIGLRGLAEVCAAAPLPCVAIGGIDASSAGAVRAVGAAGVAVVSAICGQPDPMAAARTLRDAFLEGARDESSDRPDHRDQ
ncbi:thiamine phosphate synthase [Thermasporomyces composti]|jgi:thiamine-phosphate pyrophosphorylase|uniref:Thiamine-phosphate synthase n=1 Tax=Thermasporomyces composti TaxID=696763 RepID=A0A3D9V0F0_THECX|nr:thiamine phosphate synthase [Thermasporomyces composti]REF35272.1 thiamine-phosphate diphosphorylase [Thermasporomyces composti]